ncbi:nitrate reductase subunit beta [Trichlorobacter ammonificans]|uniref:Nitrate reductase, beta subunit n=1 Tax=Trichlorobacter ammonificans TaxID=2916410 RepID=A0ABN8HF56_9BACT|nr:nitrate reductase subunit beta [Trichlorobacter ammonificans]CAH2031494.1 nitrate reductase, beta subunit [Trichlorobacter ammonificans]
MNVRAQLVMVFNLDKCIGCHACSISCKNIWTDRKGAEYMWWNNVETKPGVGYPRKWEDQETFKGGWLRDGSRLKLRALGKGPTLLNMFFQPNMPKLDDYYEPFDFDYSNLYKAPPGSDQPVAEAFSQISGKRMEEITGGPNWDDDLSGSQTYAASDVNLEDRSIVEDYGRMFMQYLPRICNHCLNPACVASCPSRALYKRGEDGVVLVDQEVCKGWRFCTSACPYKKVYFNWQSGKAEKCIFCFPRVESGQCNACAHSCVGRIRHVGVLLYDADRVEEALLRADDELVAAQRSVILNPRDPRVREAARANGVSEQWLTAAEKSPVYALVKEFGVALPLHPEFRTMPMAWYIPSLSPVISSGRDLHELADHGTFPLMETMRAPISYLANLLAGGNREIIAEILRKLIALRLYKRADTLGQTLETSILHNAGLDRASADRLYRLFTIAPYGERFLIPAQQREEQDPQQRKGTAGFGILKKTRGAR